MALPINLDTFEKSFLGGEGTLDVTSAQDAWMTLFQSGKPFPKDVDDVADLKLNLGGSQSVSLGSPTGPQISLTPTAAFTGQIELIFAGQQKDILATYGVEDCLPAGQLLIALTLHGNMGLDGAGNAGAASFNLGAGGAASWTRLMQAPDTTPAKKLLLDLFAGMRLPGSITKAADIPAPCEVIAVTRSGYLNLSSTISWGYNMAGVKSESVGDLDLAFNYAVQAAATAELGYKLAGDHTIELRRGAQDGWLRIQARKSRDATFDFAADFGLNATLNTTGLPATADEFLSALFGNDVRSILSYAQQAQELSDIDTLRTKVGDVAYGYLDGLAQGWLGEALSNATVSKFLSQLNEMVEAYNNADQTLINLYQQNLAKIPELTATLAKLEKVTSRQELTDLDDSEAYQLIDKYYGDKIYDALLDNAEFAKLRDWITSANQFVTGGGAEEKLRNFITAVKEKLGLDPIFTQLSKIDTPAELEALTDLKVQSVVDKIVGKVFSALEGSEFADVLAEVHEFLTKVEDFKKKWYSSLQSALNQSLAFDINYRYTRAKATDRLLDVEINLTNPQGAELIKAACKGDFTGILGSYNPKVVLVHPDSKLTQSLKKSSQLQLNVFGWGATRLFELTQNLEQSIESEPGGLVHVFSLDTQAALSVTKGKEAKEERQSTFLLQAVGATFQKNNTDVPVDAKGDYLIECLRRLGVQYNLVNKDAQTDPQELEGCLELAHYLGLIPNTDKVVRQLEKEFPKGFGAVSTSYEVRYNDDAVSKVFDLGNTRLDRNARAAMREIVGTSYLKQGPAGVLVEVGLAYMDGEEDAQSVTLPGWLTGGAPQRRSINEGRRILLTTLFATENKFVKKLKNLDTAFTQAKKAGETVSVTELQKTTKQFTQMSSELAKRARDERYSPFFAVFDQLVRAAGNGQEVRQSAMILKVTPPGGTTVTKYFMDPGPE